jgi:hypothetical protein
LISPSPLVAPRHPPEAFETAKAPPYASLGANLMDRAEEVKRRGDRLAREAATMITIRRISPAIVGVTHMAFKLW